MTGRSTVALVFRGVRSVLRLKPFQTMSAIDHAPLINEFTRIHIQTRSHTYIRTDVHTNAGVLSVIGGSETAGREYSASSILDASVVKSAFYSLARGRIIFVHRTKSELAEITPVSIPGFVLTCETRTHGHTGRA